MVAGRPISWSLFDLAWPLAAPGCPLLCEAVTAPLAACYLLRQVSMNKKAVRRGGSVPAKLTDGAKCHKLKEIFNQRRTPNPKTSTHAVEPLSHKKKSRGLLASSPPNGVLPGLAFFRKLPCLLPVPAGLVGSTADVV